MRIALIISGYLRSFENNYIYLKENLLDLYDVDIYIHITNNCEKKYINKTENIFETIKKLKTKVTMITDNLSFTDDNNYNNIYNQNYKFYLLNKQRQEIEKIENIKYDIVMKLRPDICIQENIIFENISDFVYIPTDNKMDKSKLKNYDDKYLCDIIAYGSPNIMDKYFDLYKNLDKLITKYGYVNETLLYNYLNDFNIPYKLTEIKYFVVLSLINTIAITGDSGVGKSRLSQIIKKLFDSSFILECDRYHKWERGNNNWNQITHLNPNANYITKMNNDVFDLKIGNNIYQVDYDHNTGKFTDKQTIESKDNIIVCGLHTFYMSKNIIDLKIFIDAADSVKIPWKINRDTKKRGYTIEKIVKQIEDRKEDFNKYILPQKNEADIIIYFYNDNKNFNINLFHIDDVIEHKFKVGINKKYDLKNIIRNLIVKNIENDELFYFILFETDDFDIVIQEIIMSFFNL